MKTTPLEYPVAMPRSWTEATGIPDSRTTPYASPAVLTDQTALRVKRIAELARNTPGLSSGTRSAILLQVRRTLNSDGPDTNPVPKQPRAVPRMSGQANRDGPPSEVVHSSRERLNDIERVLARMGHAFALVHLMVRAACRSVRKRGGR